jgi:hypothetical protein
MKCNKKLNPGFIAMLAIAYSLGLCSAHAQQSAGSGSSSASASHAAAGASQTGGGRMAASGGGSSWTAGKGSFGSQAQQGGTWRAGSSRSSIPGAGHGAPAYSSGLNAAPSTNALAGGMSNPTPATGRVGASSGATHLAHSSTLGSGGTASSRRTFARASGASIGAGRSRQRPGLGSHAYGRGMGGRPATGGGAGTAEHAHVSSFGASHSPISELTAGQMRSTTGLKP